MQSLTRGSSVAVSAFTEWVAALAGERTADQPRWSKYDEPTVDVLGRAFDEVASSTVRYDAIIIDEGQDFRAEWWTLIEASLSDPRSGTLYIFHDDKQALLPHRASYPFEEPIIDLSRNCRNGGRIYDVMRCLHAGAPECEPDLRNLGHLFVETSRPGFERDTVQRAIGWFPLEELKRLVVVFCGSSAFTESVFSDLHIPLGPAIGWREEVRRSFAHACTGRSVLISTGGIAAVNARLDDLSDSVRPTAKDLMLVNAVARGFPLDPRARRAILDSPNHRQGLVWQIVGGRARLRRRHGSSPIWASEIIMHFDRDDWHEGLPDVETAGFTRDLNIGAKWELPVYHVSEFKGLESSSVLLYIHNLSMPVEELLVGISRARLYLAIVIDNAAERGLPPSLRSFFRDAAQPSAS